MSIDQFDPSEFGFLEGSAIFGYPPDARKSINEARTRIQGPHAYERFWNLVLLESEREQLGNDLEDCYQQSPCPINVLCRLRDWGPEQSVVEIAHQLQFLSPQRYAQLCRVMGIDATAVAAPSSGSSMVAAPCWNHGTGRLEFNGQLCRKLQVRNAKLIVPILDAFESEGWPTSIQSPIDSSIDRQRIHDAVANLNRSLAHIRFHVQGESIIWREYQ